MNPSSDFPAGRLCKKPRLGADAPAATVLKKSAPLKPTGTASTAAAICSRRQPTRTVTVQGHLAVRVNALGRLPPPALAACTGLSSILGEWSATPGGKKIVCPTASNLLLPRQLPAMMSATVILPFEPS